MGVDMGGRPNGALFCGREGDALSAMPAGRIIGTDSVSSEALKTMSSLHKVLAQIKLLSSRVLVLVG